MINQRPDLAREMPPVRIDRRQARALRHAIRQHAHESALGNVRVSEAPSYAQPVLSYDSASKGAEAYRALAIELLARHPLHLTAEELGA